MYINHRHYILLVLALVTVVLSALGYTVLYRAIVSQSVRAHEAMKEIASVDEKQKHAEDAASIYTKTSETRTRIANLAVSQEKIVDFITSVEKLGDDAGVQLELSSITNEPFAAGKTTGYIKGRVDARGSWTNIMKALILIEHLPHSVSLSNVRLVQTSVTPSEELPVKFPQSSASKVWNLTLDIKALTTK